MEPEWGTQMTESTRLEVLYVAAKIFEELASGSVGYDELIRELNKYVETGDI